MDWPTDQLTNRPTQWLKESCSRDQKKAQRLMKNIIYDFGSFWLADMRRKFETLQSFHAPKKLDPLRHPHDDGYSYLVFQVKESIR